MALKPLNSVGGFSVGEIPTTIILANGDITTVNGTFTGLVDAFDLNVGNLANLGQVANVRILGGSSGQYLQTDGSGNLTWTTANTSTIFNGTSNVSIPSSGGNVNTSVGGNANVFVVTASGANLTGYFTVTGNLTSGNANLGNLAEANFVNVSSNLFVTNTANVGNLRTDNLLYANGQPWDLQEAAGSNTQLQYNDGNNNFGASANLTFDYATNVLTVAGNANVTGTLIGNVGNFSGNVTALNANLGNLATANYGNFNNDLVVQGNIANANNISVTNTLSAVTGNFSGNITSLNANLGNLATANFVNVATNVNVTGTMQAGNVRTDNLLYANGQPWDLQEAAGSNTQIQYNDGNNNFGASANFTFDYGTNQLKVTGTGNITSDLTVGGNANVTGNIVAGNISTAGSGGNISGANVVSANTLSVGNAQVSSITSSYIAYANTNNFLVGSANFTWDSATQTLGVTGNANVSGAVNTANINSGGSDLTLTANGQNAVFSASNGNFTFPGNVIAGTFYGNVNANVTVTAANTSVLFSDTGLIAGAANFTFDKTTNVFTTPGNITVNGDALVTGNANIANISFTYNVAGYITGDGNGIVLKDDTNGAQMEWNANSYVWVDGNGVNFETSNTYTANMDNVGDWYLPNNLSVVGNISNANNISVTNALNAVTGNFSGNITSLNANLGNLADANYIRVYELYNGTSNIDINPSGNIVFSPNIANVMIVSNVGVNVVGYVEANGNGTFGALYSNTLTAQGGNLQLFSQQSGDSYIELKPYGNGTVDVANFRITSLATPTQAFDAATKEYVDAAVTGLHVHAACWAATTDTLANASGGTTSYTAPGPGQVGAYISTTGTFNLIDGANVQTVGTRILVKNEANAAWNGIYTYANTTALVRATDFDTDIEAAGGDFTFINTGTVNADTGWVQTTDNPTLGTSPIVWVQFSGAGTYQAGAGLTLTGTVFSVNVDNVTTEISGGNVIVKANAQLTTPNIGAATGTSLDLTGNLLAGNVNSNATVTAVTIEASGNVLANYINANANLLVNNASINLELSGNTANFIGNVVLPNLHVNVNLDGNIGNFTGNVGAANFNTSGVANVGNLYVANYVTSNLIAGANLSYDLGSSSNRWATVYAGNIDATGNIATTGNLSANNFTANVFNANVRVDVGTSQIVYGNVTTNSITSNQTIATATISGVTGVEWMVKGYDSSGSKYSMALVTAVTDGTTADYSTFGTVMLGGSTGTLAVNVVGSNIELQVTPASTNTTVWVTQFRTI